MWSIPELELRIKASNVQGCCWGRHDAQFVNHAENVLGVQFSNDIRQFAIEVGNILLGHLNLIITGDDLGSINCITETQAIRKPENPYSCKLIKILDHAGESYCMIQNRQSIVSYDLFDINEGHETSVFKDFSAFLEWLFDEAKANMP